MKKTKKFYSKFIILNILITVISISAYAASAKNIIIMIGDGFGPGMYSFAKYYSEFVDKKPEMNLEKIAAEGRLAVMYTRSGSHLVTDSAAAATAMACGIKTTNSKIGVDANDKPAENIVETAQIKGKSIGLVTTDEVTGATVAGFSTHSSDRANGMEIASQMIDKKINVILGGGRMQFEKQKAVDAGYTVLGTNAELEKVDAGKTKLLLGLFAQGSIGTFGNRKPTWPDLPVMAGKALDILSKNPNGFFLLVESEGIDESGHDNDIEKVKNSIMEFDDTLGLIKKFADKNPDTLLIILSDHDTGGMALTRPDTGGYPTTEDLKLFKGVSWLSKNHTGHPVFLIGVGPGSDKIKGFMDNTRVHKIMYEAIR